jgi:hypothetical protein
VNDLQIVHIDDLKPFGTLEEHATAFGEHRETLRWMCSRLEPEDLGDQGYGSRLDGPIHR